jgi:Domain of unknown function (DUF222)
MIALQPDVDVVALEDRIRERNLLLQMLTAWQAEDLALFDELHGWGGKGLRDCADWVTNNLGYSPHNAKGLMAAGQAARELPEVGDAFAAGELSVDKMRLLGAGVITDSEDESAWVEVARTSSHPELARRCRESRNQQRTGPERDRAQRAQRHLRTWYDEENMFRISGALPSYEGAIVQITLDRYEKQILAGNHVDLDPPDDPRGARRADALVWICEAALQPGSGDTPSAPPTQMVVHVDYDVLTGANPNGRGHVEDGPALSTETLRRLGCTATVKTLIERDGVAIAEGRRTPTFPPAMKRAVRSRDGICGFPGCAVPATRCEVHHVEHWIDGGPTKIWNGLAMCDPHHDRHHDREFDIRRTLDGDLRFVGRDGKVLGTLTGGHWKDPRQRGSP